ncbi:MAG: PTS system glucoside-specific EIICBA component [Sodalis sp.]|uniref:hypothetical protein n=1 Tax=Sodalis sp. (in: enterobacteria) TaxID=1898979 RepID=UPI003873A954|nr:MAG: PTS system glucoside-specific EIICBA component [Sodalis sp.]
MLASVLALLTIGITWPLEFCFIFVSPMLFIFHALLNGVAFMLMDILRMMIGNVQDGTIDLVIFCSSAPRHSGGIRCYWARSTTHYCPLYYVVFSAVIRRMNAETTG